MSDPPRQQGSTILFVAVGVLALLLVALVVGGASLFLRRPAPAVTTASATHGWTTPPPPTPPPPPVVTETVPVPSASVPTDTDAGAVPKALAGQGTPTVSGSLPADVIRSVVKRHMGQIRYCYEHGLATNPSLAGKVTIHFVIAADGKVASATESDSTLGAPTVTACIVSTFKAMVFPAPSGGIVNATYPLTFATAGP